MSRVLIIDDDSVRVPTLTRFIREVFPGAEIVHSETFVADWDAFDAVMLDHDLGLGGDMYDHVRKTFPEGYDGDTVIYVHSMNPVGVSNIVASLGRGIRLPYSAILSYFSR